MRLYSIHVSTSINYELPKAAKKFLLLRSSCPEYICLASSLLRKNYLGNKVAIFKFHVLELWRLRSFCFCWFQTISQSNKLRDEQAEGSEKNLTYLGQ